MVSAVTQEYAQLRIEISENGTTWTPICGMINYTVDRSSQIDETEVPDCDDESQPLSVEREVRSKQVSVSGDGVWAQSVWGTLHTWWYTGVKKHCRIANLNADTGDPEYEEGMALLQNLNNSRTKGAKVAQSLTIQFDGVPTPTAAA